MKRLLWLFSFVIIARSAPTEVECEELKLNSTSTFTHVFNCALPVSPASLSSLWRPKQIVLNCSATPALVLVGQTVKELHQKASAQPKTAWCGWKGLVNPRICELTLSPFQPTVVGVHIKRGSLLSVSQGGSCNASVSAEFSAPRFLLGLVGVLLFLHAPTLSESVVFRLSSGTLIFVFLGLIILAYVLMRMVPQRRSLAAAMFAMGSTGLAFARWVYGTWLPSWQEIITNPVFLCYVTFTSLVGLSVTYYFDNRNDARLSTILSVGLRLLGLAMVWYSPTSGEVACAAVGILPLTMLPWRKVVKWLGKASRPAALPRRTPPPRSAPRNNASLLRQAGNVPLDDWEEDNSPPRPPSLTPPIRRASIRSTPPPVREGLSVSPLLQRGIVINTVTGRPMRTDSPTYFNMVASGWVVDHVDGCISPAPTPPTKPAAVAAAAASQLDQSAMSGSANRRRAVGSSIQQ